MKLKMVDPMKSLVGKILWKARPHKPVFRGPSNWPKNIHGLGGPLPGETHNPLGKGIRNQDLSEKEIRDRPKRVLKINAYHKKGIPMPTKPKKPGRSPEGLKAAMDHRQIQELARLAGPDAVKAMHEIIKSKVASDLAKISAGQALLDRGYGKALQTSVSATVNTDGSPKEIDGEELDRRVKAAVEHIERLTKRKREKIKSPEQPADIRKLN